MTTRTDGIVAPGTGSAVMSDENPPVYRYQLGRAWDPDLPLVTWVMLNPSTASAFVNDPTITRCINFSRLWGYGRMTVVNLFALRATNPAELVTTLDPYGPQNRHYLWRAADSADLVMAAWGASVPTRYAVYAASIRRELAREPKVHCLGMTKTGQPRHPLYVKGDTTPVRLLGA